MKVLHRDIWLCADCTMVAVNADYSGLGYYLDGKELDAKIEAIDRGLADLGPHLVLDCTDEKEFTCYDCGEYLLESNSIKVKNPDCEGCTWQVEEGLECSDCSEPEEVPGCPHCSSAELSEREHGEDEFSTSDCDCCGTYLAGSRTRFAILGED